MTVTAEMNAELDAYRNGFGQLAYDKPNPSQPLIPQDHDGEPVEYLQMTYRGEPAWMCAACLKVTLGVDPETCAGCGDEDDLAPLLHGPVRCRTLDSYDGPCLVRRGDGCQCQTPDRR